MSISITISDPFHLAGVQAAVDKFNAAQQPDEEGNEPTPLTAEEYLSARIGDICMSYAKSNNIGIISSGEFVLRFTSEENAAIKVAADANEELAAYLARVRESPSVVLYSDEVQQGIAMLVSLGLITQARANEVLAYG